MGQPTLTDVAQQAGVSRQTAGLILAGKDSLFRPATIAAVTAAAAQLGYRPHGIGKALRSGRSDTIGLIQDRYRYRTMISPDLLAAVEQRLAVLGKLLVYASLSEDADPPQVLRRVIADGLLINYHAGVPTTLEHAVSISRTPSVYLNIRRATACVYHDEHDGTKRLTELCLARWGSVGYVEDAPATPADRRCEPHHSIHDRREGYEHACRLAGAAPRILRTYYGAGVASFAAQVSDLLTAPDRPRCLIFSTGQERAAVAHTIAAGLGLRVPEDLALASFAVRRNDDLPWPMPLAIQDWESLGAKAVDLLMAAIDAPTARVAAIPIPLHLLP